MLPDDARELQRIADYRMAARALRYISTGGLVWGSINVALGFVNTGPLRYVVIGLGVFMIVTGVLARKVPSSVWLLINGVVTMGIGLFNMALTALGLLGGGSSFVWGFLGLVFFLVGVGQIKTFARYGRALRDPATDEEIRHLEAMVYHATLVDPAADRRVIAFRVKKGMAEVKWRGLFHGRAVLLVEQPGQAVLAADRDDAEFAVEGKANSSGRLRAVFSIRAQQWTASIAAEALDRFDAWKAGEYDEPDEDEQDESPERDEPPPDAIRTDAPPDHGEPPPDAIKAE